MSHSHEPPVPPGNTSPYPRHEPPHAHPAPLPPKAKTPPARGGDTLPIGAIIGAAVTAGALAFGAAALFMARRDTGKKKGRGKKRR
jgi:hypothetical protein